MMKAGSTHDIILRIKGEESGEDKETGLLLATDSDGNILWNRQEVSLFPERIAMGEASYIQTAPETELVWAQDDWSAGFGEFNCPYGSRRYYESRGCDCRFRHQIILGPKFHVTTQTGDAAIGSGSSYTSVTGNRMAIFDSYIYNVAKTGSSCKIWRTDDTSNDWASVQDMGSGNAYFVISFIDWLVAAWASSTDDINYSTDGTSWSTYEHTQLADCACVVGNTLWASYGNEIQSCTDPTATGNWSSQVEVGSSDRRIQRLFSLENTLHILKEDGLYVYNSDGEVINLLQEYDGMSVFQNAHVFHNEAFLTGNSYNCAILRYSEGAISDISLQSFAPKSEFIELFSARGLAGDTVWLYMTATRNSGTFVFAGRDQGSDGWVWHPITEDSTALPEDCLLHLNQVWINQSDGKPRVIDVPRGYSLPQLSGSYYFLTSGYVLTGWWNGGFVDIDKAFRYLTIDVDNVTADRYVDVYYEVDDETTWSLLGTATREGKTTFYFDNISPALTKYGRRIRFKFDFTSDSDTETPIFKSFALHSVLRPSVKKRWNIGVKCGDNLLSLDGHNDHQTAKFISNNLNSMRESLLPLELTDMDGNDHTVMMSELAESMVAKEQGRGRERVFILTLEELM